MKRLIPVVILILAGLAYWASLPHSRLGPLTYSGLVETTSVNQGFEVAGTIQEILVREGDPVKPGQLLARLDDSAWKAAEDQAEARLKTARARLLEAKNGPRPAEIEQARARTEQAQADLAQMRNGATRPELDAAKAAADAAQQRYQQLSTGYRQEDVSTAKAQLEAARENLSTLKVDYDRYVRLHREGAVPDQLLDTRKNQYVQALRGFESATENFKKLRTGPRREEIEAARQDYRNAQARYQDLLDGTRPELIAKAEGVLAEREQALRLMREGTRPEEIQQAQHQVAEAEGALRQAQVNRGHTRLEAATEGVVLTRNFEPGDSVGANAAVVSVADLAHPWVYIFIPEPELSQVKLRAKAKIRVDSLQGQDLTGEVIRVYEKAEFTPKFIQTTHERVNLVYRAKVAVENPELRLRPGMPADVQVEK